MMDQVLAMISEDMDGTEGKSAMSHSAEECTDPMTCTDHDDELGKAMTPDGVPAVKIEVSKLGIPSMDGAKDEPSLDDKGEAGEGLSEEDANILKKLLR